MKGFTLIELLVVLLIIGLGVSIVGVNVGGDSHRQLRVDARQFANGTELMAQEAVLGNRQWGVDFFRVDKDGESLFGYRWLVLSDDGQWQKPYDETFAEEYEFSAQTGMRLQLEGLENEQDIEYRKEAPVEQPQTGPDAGKSQTKIVDQNNSITKRDRVEPEILLLSSGEMNAFELTLFDALDPDATITIDGDELGRVRVERGDSDEL